MSVWKIFQKCKGFFFFFLFGFRHVVGTGDLFLLGVHC